MKIAKVSNGLKGNIHKPLSKCNIGFESTTSNTATNNTTNNNDTTSNTTTTTTSIETPIILLKPGENSKNTSKKLRKIAITIDNR